MGYSQVIFDFDGTVADTFEFSYVILNRLAGDYGFRKLGRGEVEMARDMSAMEMIRFLGVPMGKLPSIITRGYSELKQEMERVPMVPGMREALLEMKERGVGLGVLTSNAKENVELFLRRHELECFDFVASSSKIFGKAREMRKLLKRYSLKKEEVCYVGDEVRDVEAAREAGLSCAAVVWGYNSRKALAEAGPTYVFSTPEEMAHKLAA